MTTHSDRVITIELEAGRGMTVMICPSASEEEQKVSLRKFMTYALVGRAAH